MQTRARYNSYNDILIIIVKRFLTLLLRVKEIKCGGPQIQIKSGKELGDFKNTRIRTKKLRRIQWRKLLDDYSYVFRYITLHFVKST